MFLERYQFYRTKGSNNSNNCRLASKICWLFHMWFARQVHAMEKKLSTKSGKLDLYCVQVGDAQVTIEGLQAS